MEATPGLPLEESSQHGKVPVPRLNQGTEAGEEEGAPGGGQPHQYPCFLVMGQAGVLPTSRALSWRCLGFLLGMGREKKPKVQQQFEEGGGPLCGPELSG